MTEQQNTIDIEIKALQQALYNADLQVMELESLISFAEDQLRQRKQGKSILPDAGKQFLQ